MHAGVHSDLSVSEITHCLSYLLTGLHVLSVASVISAPVVETTPRSL